jgi:single-stranded DNA-binding protein
VQIIADSVQFLGSRDGGGQGGGGNGIQPTSDVPADTADFEQPAATTAGTSDDDIPF